MKWTKAYRKAHGKEMLKDSVFDFEKKRNEPVKYNRELYVNTIKAMKRIKKIKESREEIFNENRLKIAKRSKKLQVKNELLIHETLIPEGTVKNLIKTELKEKHDQKEKEYAEKTLKASLKAKKAAEKNGMDEEGNGSESDQEISN